MHVWERALMTGLAELLTVFVCSGLGGSIGLFVFHWLNTPFPK